MQTLRYKIDVDNAKTLHKLGLQLQQIIADFIIQFESEQTYYILIIKGNREVADLIKKTLNLQGVSYLLLNTQLTLETQDYDN